MKYAYFCRGLEIKISLESESESDGITRRMQLGAQDFRESDVPRLMNRMSGVQNNRIARNKSG